MARKLLGNISKWMLYVAGTALASIMFLTVADVILRAFKAPIAGTYELVGFLAAWAIGFAIPQTSMDKGHVLMDFLTGKLPSSLDGVLRVTTRLIGVGFFVLVAYNLYAMGNDLRASGDETALRHLPLYPLAYGIAFSCFVECLVLGLDLFTKGETNS